MNLHCFFMELTEFNSTCGSVILLHRTAQNCDRSSECEIMSLRRRKFVFDVAPLEIIIDDKELFEEEDEDSFHGVFAAAAAAAAALRMNMNQINLVIQAVNHDFISQYWSLKSDQQQQQLQLNSSSSSSCHGQHDHRDHHHLRDEDDDEEMIMIACQPPGPPATSDPVIVLDRASVFASSAASAADDYIMSKLRDLDLLYEIEWIFKLEQLEEVKRCIIQRISEAKPALLLLAAKPNTALRIRVDLSTIFKRYYANPAAAASAHVEDELDNCTVAEDFAIHYPAAAAAPPTFYDDDDDDKPSRTPLTTALRSSKEALETKILEEEDLISSSSSSCSVCLNEFHVGVDEIKKMPCSHVFHWNCLMNWLWERNTCPLCYYKLPTFSTRFLENQLP